MTRRNEPAAPGWRAAGSGSIGNDTDNHQVTPATGADAITYARPGRVTV